MKILRQTLVFCLITCYVTNGQTKHDDSGHPLLTNVKNEIKTSNRNDSLKNKMVIKYYQINKKNKKNEGGSGHLGSSCFSDEDCGPGQGHVCSGNTCDCHTKYVQHNATHCLPGVLLGFSCITHSQCRVRVADSSCIQEFCRCGAGTVPYRRANCLNASLLGESCRTHSQCSLGTVGSACKWIVKNVMGKCQCKPGMPRREYKCGPPGFALGAPCGKSYDCAQHVPGSICVGSVEDKKKSSESTFSLFPSRTSKFNEVSYHAKEEKPNVSLGGICECPKGYFVIKNGTRCVPVKKEIGVSPVSLGKPCLFSSQCKASDPYSFCNEGVCDCSMETSHCSPRNTGCSNETFQCISDGRCLSANFVCDGKQDCNDGSDELECLPGRCSSLAFKCDDGFCVSRGRICDRKIDCPDGSDEDKCDSNTGGCPPTTFRCNNGECLPGFSFCNAFISCGDKSDEDTRTCVGGVFRVPFCPFRCKNGRCRSTAIICSGKDGCGDNSDEEKCSVCNCPKP